MRSITLEILNRRNRILTAVRAGEPYRKIAERERVPPWTISHTAIQASIRKRPRREPKVE